MPNSTAIRSIEDELLIDEEETEDEGDVFSDGRWHAAQSYGGYWVQPTHSDY